jgi:hypothetical protein
MRCIAAQAAHPEITAGSDPERSVLTADLIAPVAAAADRYVPIRSGVPHESWASF